MPLLPLGTRGENFIQTYQTRWGVLQFHLGLPGVPRFDEAEPAAVTRPTERGTPVKCLSGPPPSGRQASRQPSPGPNRHRVSSGTPPCGQVGLNSVALSQQQVGSPGFAVVST